MFNIFLPILLFGQIVFAGETLILDGSHTITYTQVFHVKNEVYASFKVDADLNVKPWIFQDSFTLKDSNGIVPRITCGSNTRNSVYKLTLCWESVNGTNPVIEFNYNGQYYAFQIPESTPTGVTK